MNFFNIEFKRTVLAILVVEVLSFVSYFYLGLNNFVFFALVLLTGFLAYRKLEYGLMIVFGELFIGSQGYLFFYEFFGFKLSIRIALWAVVMVIWFFKFLVYLRKNKKEALMRYARVSFFKYCIILSFFVLWGVFNGLYLGNNFRDLFFDFNGWIYFGLLFPFVYVYFVDSKSSELKEGISRLLGVMSAACMCLSVKTLMLLYVFSHKLSFGVVSLTDIYKWVRDTRVGEITAMKGGFYRIFFQSHIFPLVFSYFLILFVLFAFEKKKKSDIDKKAVYVAMFILILCMSVNIVSLSRSNWVGLIVGLLFVLVLVYWMFDWRKMLKVFGVSVVSFLMGLLLMVAVIKMPAPGTSVVVDASKVLSDRVVNVNEDAVSSRWALLPVLWKEIRASVILGKGFGANVIYKSSDPRVLEANPSGEYSTFAFEWGWLDIWLKIGLFGFMAYLLLLFYLLFAKFNAYPGLESEKKVLLIFSMGAIVCISSLSFLSPYTNHPLGIGLLMFVSLIIEYCRNEKIA